MSEPELDALMERVLNATRQYGDKAKLAEFLGVSSQQLNNWLTRICSPGGEITLRLQKWVSAEEAKQKSPDRASTRPERKTQLRKASYDKPKSGQIQC